MMNRSHTTLGQNVFSRLQRCFALFVTGFISVFSLASCSEKTETAGKTAAEPPPARVDVIRVTGEPVAIYRDVPAQTYARDKVDVRGRVDGYIEKWLFKPGQTVKEGQPLYVLDLRPYQAQLSEAKGKLEEVRAQADFAKQQVSLQEAQANLAKARSALLKATQDYQRYKNLVEEGAVSRQDFDTATANLTSAQATERALAAAVQQAKVSTKTQIESSQAKVEAQKAIVEQARLNVRYSTIKAPISGLIGESKIPVGGLVSATSTSPLTTIVPLDPIWVRFKVTEAQYLNYKSKHRGAPPPLEMYLADGTKFPYTGKVSNTLNEVDQRTGTLEIQAQFPNPNKAVLPGQFARVRYVRENLPNALTVPVKAVQQTQSQTSVFVVDDENKAESRVVKLGPRVGEKFVVEEGLKEGEKLVVEGLMAIRPGSKVIPNVLGPSATASKPQGIR